MLASRYMAIAVLWSLAALCTGAFVSEAIAQQVAERQVFFGDLHLHTSYSLDAAATKTETTPDDAYRFARGEPVRYYDRTVVRHTPLDFLAVTDHAEYLGNVRLAMQSEIDLPGDGWERQFAHDGGPDMWAFFARVNRGLFGEDTPGLSNPALVAGHWRDIIDAAERHYEPGRFTSFVAFEYSPNIRATPSAHLHRNVIFRGPDYPAMPFAATDSLNPESLWAYADTNRRLGIDSLMIPHNTNISYGRAFSFEDVNGEPIDAEYAQTRARNEPLVEITQNKGTIEARPEISPDDEFADFELIDAGKDQPGGSYVRYGLQRGLEIAEQLGINPFELGFVGATDFHSGISTTEEDNFPGALGLSDSHRDPEMILQEFSPIIGSPLAALSASGITGVWAEENTREAIFDALRRREAFATSGPLIRVRMFAGWGDAAVLGDGPDWADQAYAWGVPMGGVLAGEEDLQGGPGFVVHASKDPHSGNLDRIQIVKLWRRNGRSFEKIYDVAWSPGRAFDDETGRLKPVGNTVDAQTATYENSIGAAELYGTWRDPDFDPAERALYYARVIEIPTPRWATYLSVQSGVPLNETVPTWLQERAWTSPVYYTP